MPLMRALVLEYPHDRRAARAEDEYLFGPDLLAAPVVRGGARSRPVYLPRGRWLDARRALAYDAAGDGAFHVRPAPLLRGGRGVRARARLDELPLYIRAGAVIPMLPADVSTLASYGRGRVVRLADRARVLRLLAFPTRSSWRLRVADRAARRYRLEAALRVRACSVELNGRALPRSAWRQRGGVLSASFSTRRAVLAVRGC
jgi:hypothetical protein